MNREINFYVNKIDDIRITSDTFNGRYTGRRLFAGYAGESDATKLTLEFNPDFDGYGINLVFTNKSATETASYTLADELTIEYNIPESLMLPEVIGMVIEAELDDQKMRSRKIDLGVKRD